jgi:hypothetical protein
MGNSTGPRTPRGKARSSQNAAKHWIESCRILPEEQKEAIVLRKGLTEDFKPEGMIENEVIDDLTLNRLIKRRIDTAFTREFAKAAIEKKAELAENYEGLSTQFWLGAVDAGYGYWAEGGLVERLPPDACIAFLEALKRRIGARGPQPEDLAELRLYYGSRPIEQAALAMHQLELGPKQAADDNELKEDILETFDAEIAVQRNKRDLAEKAYAIETASDLQEPVGPALDTLLRYRSANIREFKDLLDCLERIRRLGRGAA